jgi:glycerophosphoryl diester phosphodiesterase
MRIFLLSPQGIITILLGLIFGLMVILVEFGGLTLISYQAITKQKESSFLTILKYSLYKIRYLLSIDGFFIVFYLFIIIPLINSDLKISIFKQLKIPGFIMDVINLNLLYQIYLGIVLVIFIILAVRWIFVLPIILLNNNKVKHPLKESVKLVRQNYKYIFKYAIFISSFNIIVFFLISSVLLLILPKFYFEIVWPLTISGGFILSLFILTPFYAILFTRLYITIKGEENIEVFLAIKDKDTIIDKLLNNTKLCILLFVLFVIMISVYTYSFIDKIDDIEYDVKITSHRGDTIDSPENTLAAIEEAIHNGADFAEIDVQETKDLKLILLHDKSFKRTTGIDKSPWELTLNEIKELDAGSWFSNEYTGEKIPTLNEAIDYSKGKISLNIEIKTDKHNKNIAREVVKVIKENGIIDTCVVTSLDYEVLEEIEKYESKIKTGYIMYMAIGDLNKLNIDFYSVEETLINKKFIVDAHNNDREVHVWTINTVESMENILEFDVDNIITDNVKELKQLIENNDE